MRERVRVTLTGLDLPIFSERPPRDSRPQQLQSSAIRYTGQDMMPAAHPTVNLHLTRAFDLHLCCMHMLESAAMLVQKLPQAHKLLRLDPKNGFSQNLDSVKVES